ncbi:hypothetical protein CFY91_09270 [Pseudomonas fluvialis]|uniref:hypothetical protein n=1 Tax=Pseudomonas fluvialis TaxID=1793966 RepID=UPI000B8AB4A9|nr:hypothetical protein [Pseudomonas fluvialis]OXM40403.1 hypothetical protein CFY91_09270 [Pseudomonas fluvialis]
MKITSPEQVSSAIWRTLFICSLAVLAITAIVVVRLTSLYVNPMPASEQIVEMAYWRISLLLAFQSAPLVWMHFIYKGYKNELICIPLYQTMTLLKVPLATWVGGCFIAVIFLWPMLKV